MKFEWRWSVALWIGGEFLQREDKKRLLQLPAAEIAETADAAIEKLPKYVVNCSMSFPSKNSAAVSASSAASSSVFLSLSK